MLDQTHAPALPPLPKPEPVQDRAALERLAIVLGVADARRAPAPHDPADGPIRATMASIAGAVAGRRSARPLADERLEALRRFAMAVARGRAGPEDVSRLADAGYGPGRIDEIGFTARCLAGLN